ncbi:MAG: hypothetical protein DME14_13985 [Candidatus Rokuibacteriota bacterium]|nr:MAG: hypothetical protein DME14_13985 [Candidatus Rokubacteria bacterium]
MRVSMRAYVAVFVSVFLAELGDTTQLATLFFAANPGISKLGVLVASAAALCLSTTLAGLAGRRTDSRRSSRSCTRGCLQSCPTAAPAPFAWARRETASGR